MLRHRSPGRVYPCTSSEIRSSRLRRGTIERHSEEQLFSHGVGRARRMAQRMVAPPPCGARTALQCSTTNRRAVHVRASASSRHLGAARECARRSSYLVSVERVVSLIEGLSQHRVVRGQR
eukprot:1224380-Prymnesium_polylepis.1